MNTQRNTTLASIDSLFQQALGYIQQGRFSEALIVNDQAARINPDLAEVHYNCGYALKEAGRLQEALSAYNQAIQLRPDYVAAHCNRGLVLADLQDCEEAISAFDLASPHHCITGRLLGTVNTCMIVALRPDIRPGKARGVKFACAR